MNEPVLSSAGDESYRPISGFALAGLFLGGGFAALVVFGAMVAIVKGAPIFFPLWLLLAPIAGFVLGIVGRGQIVGPGATRDGLRLANLAVLLSVFSGLGYAAYFVSIGLAVSNQADEFVSGDPEPNRGFLKHLMRSGASPADLDIAFLLTRPATARIKYRAGDDELFRTTYDQPSNDAQAGEATRFKSRKFIRMITQAGDKATFESLGAREWEYDKASYKVARNYRVTTPQAVFDIILYVESTEPEAEGQVRQWFVNLNRSPVERYQLTSLGRNIEQLTEQGRFYVENQWQPKSREGKAVEDFAKFDKSDWPKLIADASERGKNKPVEYQEFYRGQARAIFEGKSTDSFTFQVDSASWPNWGQDAAGRVWIDHSIRMTLHGDAAKPPLAAEGHLRLRSKIPVDVTKSGMPPVPQWDVEELVIERVRMMKAQM